MEKKKFKVKYNNSKGLIELDGYGIQGNIVSLFYPNIQENISGFVIYDPDGNVYKDCSEYKYRYDVLEDNPNAIYYTDLENMVQTEKWNYGNDDQVEIDVEPLTNEEVTACIATLMYETSLMKLGMEG
ncbi:MAG: hypothetical protein K2O32_04155 [Acetatifactor sp.]|nr:hypothetical protein [Acetatifactor sp.]